MQGQKRTRACVHQVLPASPLPASPLRPHRLRFWNSIQAHPRHISHTDQSKSRWFQLDRAETVTVPADLDGGSGFFGFCRETESAVHYSDSFHFLI